MVEAGRVNVNTPHAARIMITVPKEHIRHHRRTLQRARLRSIKLPFWEIPQRRQEFLKNCEPKESKDSKFRR